MSKQPYILIQAARFLNKLEYDSIPDNVIDTAKKAILDYIGVAIAGSSQPVAQNLLNWSKQRSSTGCATVIGSSSQLDVEHAALVNAASGHALDFDDTSWATIGHPTTVILPALLALAEEHDLSGKQLLAAYVSGVEVAHKIADLMMPIASGNGWHTTGIFYVLGTAAAACQLLNLDEDSTVSAMALALSKSSGIRSNFGTQSKPYHAGMAAKSGLESISLVQHGITSSPGAFEGQDGFVQCYTNEALAEKVHNMSKPVMFGKGWDIAVRGYAFKKYPNCSGNHPACDLMMDLLAAEKISYEKVASIHCGVSLLGPKELVCHQPTTPVEARFSLEFSIASALVYGQITLDEFTEEKIRDPRVQTLMASITMKVDDDLAKLGFIGTAPVKMWINLKSGEQLFVEKALAKGNPEKPFSEEEFIAKFNQCTIGKVNPLSRDQLCKLLLNLQDVTSISQVTAFLKF